MKPAAIAFLAFAAAVPAYAQSGNETAFWATAGDWQVRVDRGACYAAASYLGSADGRPPVVVRIGFNPDVRGYSLMFASTYWTTMRDRQSYPVSISIDGGRPFVWTGYGLHLLNGVPALNLPFDNSHMIEQLAGGYSMHVTANGYTIFYGPLAGSNAAMAETARCQQAMNEAANPGRSSANVSPF